MTKAGSTHITLVSDRSGSMENIQADAEGGINRFIDDQKKQPGECSLLLVEFDTFHDTVYGPGPIKEAQRYTLIPRGGTALLDAMGTAIVRTGQYLKDMDEKDRPEHVVFVTVTDGEENSSKEYSVSKDGYKMIKDMVERQTNTYGWVFEFLAANIDAFNVGASLGHMNTTSYAASSMSTNAVYDNLSANVSSLRSTGKYAGGTRHVDANGNYIDDPANTTPSNA